MARSYRDSGIILKRHNLGEADTILTILSRHHGIIRTAAKGVRRIKSRKGGNTELFNQIDGLIVEGRNLDILQEVTAVDTFEHWRNDLSSISLAYYLADITIMALHEGESVTYMHDRLVEALAWLGRTQDNSLLLRWYEVQLLHYLGYWSATNLDSQSHNAIALLDGLTTREVAQVATMKPSSELGIELERLMQIQMSFVLDRQPKSESFISIVRDLDQRI